MVCRSVYHAQKSFSCLDHHLSTFLVTFSMHHLTVDNEPGQRVVDPQRRNLDGVGTHIGPWHRLDSEADTSQSNLVRPVVQRFNAILEVCVSDEKLAAQTTEERQRVFPSDERHPEVVGDVATGERPEDRHLSIRSWCVVSDKGWILNSKQNVRSAVWFRCKPLRQKYERTRRREYERQRCWHKQNSFERCKKADTNQSLTNIIADGATAEEQVSHIVSVKVRSTWLAAFVKTILVALTFNFRRTYSMF